MTKPLRKPVKGPRKPSVRSHSGSEVRNGTKRHLRAFRVGEGLPSLTQLRNELHDMRDVLMGRVAPPIWEGVLTLQEVADAYYARAAEITMMIQELETDGRVDKGDPHYKFRTGELRTFMNMAGHATNLGSRRLTYETYIFEKEKYGRESAGEEG